MTHPTTAPAHLERALRAVPWVAAGLASGCIFGPWGPVDVDTDDTGEVPNRLFATPDDVYFRTSVTATGSETHSFQLVNGTDETLDVWGYTEVEASDEESRAAFTVEGLPLFETLRPGDFLEVPVTFTPRVDQSYRAWLTIRDTVRVDLVGEGLAPRLGAEVVTEPEVDRWCVGAGRFSLENVGREILEIGDIDVTGLGDFTLPAALPTTLAPDTRAFVDTTFRPSEEGPRFGVVEFGTNDPLRPRFRLLLEGIGLANDARSGTFRYGAGDGVALLIALDDVGDVGEGDRSYVDGAIASLGRLLTHLSARGIAWRLAAASTGEICPPMAPEVGDASTPRLDLLLGLGETLRDGSRAYDDALLELVHQTVARAEAGTCLAPLLAPRQGLHAVVISPRADRGVAGWAAGLESIREHVSGDVVVSAIVPDPGCGDASGYVDAAAATGGVVGDPCTASWDAIWASIADVTAGLESGPTSFVLDAEPIADSIRVDVDGAHWGGWELSGRTVLLTEAPEDGAEVDVSWSPRSACP